MKRWVLLVTVLFVWVLPLAGCVMGEGQTQAALHQLVNADDDRFARKQLDDFIAGRLAPLYDSLDPSEQKPDAHTVLASAYALVPKGALQQSTLVDVSFRSYVSLSKDGSSERLSNLTYQLQFPSSFLRVLVVVRTAGGKRTIAGFHVTTMPISLHDQNAPRLSSHGALLGALAVLFGGTAFLFSVVTAIRCAYSTRSRKWLWVLYALTGVGAVTVDWTTGGYLLQLGALHLPVFSFLKTYYGPLVLTVNLPVGAIHAHMTHRPA